MAPRRPSSPPLPKPSPNGPLSCRSNNDDSDIDDMSDTGGGFEDDEETAGKEFNALGMRLLWSDSCTGGWLLPTEGCEHTKIHSNATTKTYQHVEYQITFMGTIHTRSSASF